MSSDSARIVEASLAAGAAGDPRTAMAMFSDDVVARYAESLPFGGEHVGLPSYLAALAELNDKLRLQVENAEVVAAEGDRVLLFLDIVYQAKSTGRSTRQRSVEVLTFDSGAVVRVDVYHGDPTKLIELLNLP
jgi:ketosteroid isomerase-like protein